ncbi:MAG: hypothetical protein HYY13_02540 [Nitrospirae bacterium]|nr:hypothetical protein [Nitrospirota bacterium]
MRHLIGRHPMAASVAASVFTTVLIHAMWLAVGPARADKEAPPVTPILKAQLFVVADESGKNRAYLGLMPDGSVGLRIDDTGGAPRSILSLSKKGSSGLVLTHANSKTTASLFVGADGWPGISMTDLQGRTVPWLAAAPAAVSPTGGAGESADPRLALPGYEMLNYGGAGDPAERKQYQGCRKGCAGVRDTALQQSCLKQCE